MNPSHDPGTLPVGWRRIRVVDAFPFTAKRSKKLCLKITFVFDDSEHQGRRVFFYARPDLELGRSSLVNLAESLGVDLPKGPNGEPRGVRPERLVGGLCLGHIEVSESEEYGPSTQISHQGFRRVLEVNSLE